MARIHETDWIPALSQELKGFPSLAIKMTARRIAPRLGITYATEMPSGDVAVLREAVRADIQTMLASVKK